MPDIAQKILVFYVNGRKIEDEKFNPKWTLLQYLRTKLRLCGTKLGCGEGGCGACTVMVSRYDRTNNRIEHLSVNACLTPVASVHGQAVTTVEGIGNTKTGLHPVQQRLFKAHGSQCGFCTPGIVMSMYTLLRQNKTPTYSQMEDTFQGNLCRCTGYRPIIQGLKGLTDNDGCCQLGNGCCQNKEQDMAQNFFDEKDMVAYDPTQEPIFPPELMISAEYDQSRLRFESDDGVVWYRPTTLQQLLKLKEKFPEAKLPVGNTEIGVEMKLKKCDYRTFIAINGIAELNSIKETEKGIEFGAAVTLTQVQQVLRHAVQTQPEYKTRVFSSVLYMLQLFAGSQIRNVACIGGNLATASPISDLNPILLASGAEIVVASVNSHRRFKMEENFFRGYRRTQLEENDVIISITIPFTNKNEYFSAFKQSQRRHDDIAIVNAAIRLQLDPNTNIVKDIFLAYGGVAPTTVAAVKTMNSIKEKLWDECLLQEACRHLSTEFPLDESTPGGMSEYRRTLVLSFFYKFYLGIQLRLQHEIPDSFKSATRDIRADPPKASQVYQLVASGQRKEDPIGRPLEHYTSAQQVCGEAVYCDDLPTIEGELFLSFVLSSEAHAKILSIDAEAALAVPGVVSFVSADDCPGERNVTGTIQTRTGFDEQVFAKDRVTCLGQTIGAIVASDKETAQIAARLVRVEYELLDPIITIEEAIEANSVYDDMKRTIINGDAVKALHESDHVLQGEMRIGGQNHFYLEPQTGRAIPKNEHGEMEIIAASQSPHQIQTMSARALGIAENRIVVKVKRLGGGFGGKETRTTMLCVPLAVAANKVGRPVRFCLDRDEDMLMIGGRHPFLVRYKVGFTSDGRLLSLIADIYTNGGHVLDLSQVVLDTALTKLDCAYRLPNVHLTGTVCKTNIATNTAFRGFGAPQMIVWMEAMMQDIAQYLAIDPVRVREINMYEEGDCSFYGQVLEHCTVKRCWNECYLSSDFAFRREECQRFNRENRWKKRGIAIIPLKYGMGYPILPLNQGTALVHIYTDGSVLVNHGGVEMGQGLNIKMIQVASRALGIATNKIHINETSTEKTPNATQTAASFSSDLFGMAILNACQTLLERLEPVINANPKGTWDDWINAAYIQRINLSVAGHYKAPDCGEMDFIKMRGQPYQYFSYGAGCSEVEIDVLTGDHRVLRTDIVMDVGESLNPAIDVGQIEGGFVQGYGLFTMEQLRYSPKGMLYTRGPGNYKIPGFDDIPNTLNVALLKGSPNKRAIYSSKGIGEPPLLLAASVFIAIKNAIAAARTDDADGSIFRLDSPATAEKIRMSCSDRFVTQVEQTKNVEKKVPWEIVV